jgi:hypothetical protein
METADAIVRMGCAVAHAELRRSTVAFWSLN